MLVGVSGTICSSEPTAQSRVQTSPSGRRSDAHSVKGDVPIDDEATMMTQSLGGAHRGMVCVCVFIEVSVCKFI